METRNFDRIGKPLSLLGMGMMRLPTGKGEADIDQKQVDEMVDYALDHGVNYFDTAWMYHEFRSEVAAGKALGRHPRDRYNLATKMPLVFLREKKQVAETFEEQLRKCGVEHFDFYLFHNFNRRNYATANELEVFEYLTRMKEQGKIGKLGFSFHDKPELLHDILGAHDWDFVQIQLNYVDWELQNAEEQYKLITGAGLPVVVMEPVRGGVLATLTDDACAVLRDANPDVSIASWALRYAASLPGVMTVLSGMSNLEQVQDNVSTFSPLRPLDSAERAVIAEALERFKRTGSVPCTGCRYCMDCPSGVNIPHMFATYNQYKIHKNPYDFNNTYYVQGKESQAHNCTQCGACSPNCPQGLDIPALLAEVSAEYGRAMDIIRRG